MLICSSRCSLFIFLAVLCKSSFSYASGEEISNVYPVIENEWELEGIPSPSPQNVRALEGGDDTVGTAFAPTTPGGKCLASADYLKWKDGGYDNFGLDMQACAESCTGKLAPINCPIFQVCDKFPYRTCVSKCMADTSNKNREDLGLIGGPYSANCSACMGSLSQCVVDKCTTKCITGEQSSSCESCTVQFCTDDFMTCSGLNPLRKHESINTNAIIGGVVGGAGALVIGSVIFAYFHTKRVHKVKELSVDDLAKLSAAQQQQAAMQAQQLLASYPSQQKITQQDVMMMMQQAQQYGAVPSPGPSASTSSLGASTSSMTPYQQQYLMQQQMMPGMMVPPMVPLLAPPGMIPPGMAPPGMAPPIHVSSLDARNMMGNQVSLSRSELPMQAIQLVLKYDFVGERDDELTCKKGDIINGIEENDGWWLAKASDGKIGLVPSSYVTLDDIKISGDVKF